MTRLICLLCSSLKFDKILKDTLDNNRIIFLLLLNNGSLKRQTDNDVAEN